MEPLIMLLDTDIHNFLSEAAILQKSTILVRLNAGTITITLVVLRHFNPSQGKQDPGLKKHRNYPLNEAEPT